MLFFTFLLMVNMILFIVFFFFQAEDGIRDKLVTGVQTWLFRSGPEAAGPAGRRPARCAWGDWRPPARGSRPGGPRCGSRAPRVRPASAEDDQHVALADRLGLLDRKSVV